MPIPDQVRLKVEELEKKAEEIESSAISLFNEAPLKYSPMSTPDFVVLGSSDYSWTTLPHNLKKLQSIIVGKYRGWYKSTSILIEAYLPNEKSDFTKYYKKQTEKNGTNGIIDYLQFNVDVWNKDKRDFIQDFSNAFSYQKNILISIKYIDIEDFRILSSDFDEIKERYIDFNFSDYSLHHYDSFIDLVNKSINYNDFYKIIPYLLRCLFENLLYDLFQTSLHNHHKELYFLKSQNRARNFSQLINLLEFLKDNEYKHVIRDSINPKTIEMLETIKKIGNYTVHDVIEKVSKNEVVEWNNDINLVLKPLLASYKKLEKAKIEIETERLIKIKRKLGFYSDDEEIFDTNESEKLQELKKIDYDLIFSYLDMIEDGEIPFDNLYHTLHAIDRQLQKLNRSVEIDEQDLVKLEKICNRLLEYMKVQYENNDETERRILSVLYSFKYNQKALVILKTNCYSYFIQLFEKEKYYSNLINLLDLFDYFNNKFEEVVYDAIENNRVRFLNNFSSNIDFSKHMEKRLEIIRILNQHLAKIKSDDNGLKKEVKKIIRKFE